MQGKQQTFVRLDDWAPRAERASSHARARSRPGFALRRRSRSRDRSGFRTLGRDPRHRRPEGLARRTDWPRALGRRRYWLAADAAGSAAPAAGRNRAYLLAGFDEYFLGYKDRDAVLEPEHAEKIAPGANGVFRPLIVVGGQIVGTWTRSVRGTELTIALHPFEAAAKLAEQVPARGGPLPRLPRAAVRYRADPAPGSALGLRRDDHDSRSGAAIAARQGSCRLAVLRAARRRNAGPRSAALACAFQPRVPARLRRVAAPVPAYAAARTGGSAPAQHRPLGGTSASRSGCAASARSRRASAAPSACHRPSTARPIRPRPTGRGSRPASCWPMRVPHPTFSAKSF